MLWLALHFPRLALEALSLQVSPEAGPAQAVVERGRIVVADQVAAAAGVLPGQRRSTALGLLPGLRIHERDPAREARALVDLACWAGRFTPTLSVLPASGLLLEIGACERLFGGIEVIVQQVVAGCQAQGWQVRWAVAPTPLGARWLARAGVAAIHATWAELQPALDTLSCAVPDWSSETLARLESFGLPALGDLRAQAAAGLRRRIGNAPLDDLLRAYGEMPDPQPSFVFPECFAMELELPSRVEFAEGLSFAAQRLFAALVGWLQARQLLLRVCTLHLTHDDASSSALALRFGEPCADEARCLRLLREHLTRLQLAAPVEALRLTADEVVARSGSSAALFEQAARGEGAAACVDRLRARLGNDAVRSVLLHADHRPECATVNGDPASIFAAKRRLTVAPDTPRPLWLLAEPQLLFERSDGPHWHGPLQLLTRAERLESGWWDSGEACAVGDLRRDYFVARNSQGQCVWIFRDAQGWYLHGLFA